MPQISGTDEKTVRAAIKTAIKSISAPVGNVFDKRIFLPTRTAYANLLGVRVSALDKMEIKFCDIDFVGFEDVKDEGAIKCVPTKFVYNLHIFHQYISERKDGSNSTDHFSAAVLGIRSYFLINKQIGGGRADDIESSEFAQFGVDPFTDATGHFINLILKVKFYG